MDKCKNKAIQDLTNNCHITHVQNVKISDLHEFIVVSSH